MNNIEIKAKINILLEVIKSLHILDGYKLFISEINNYIEINYTKINNTYTITTFTNGKVYVYNNLTIDESISIFEQLYLCV